MAVPSRAPFRPRAGIAFDITELVLLRGWAEARGLGMRILLDAVRPDGEYEEVILLGPPDGQPVLTLWRTTEMVVLARRTGRVGRYAFLSEALEQARLPELRRV